MWDLRTLQRLNERACAGEEGNKEKPVVTKRISEGDLVETTEPYKNFPKGTRGWVEGVTQRARDGRTLLVIFFYPNFSGSDRQRVSVIQRDTKKLKKTGRSNVCPDGHTGR